MKIVCSGSSAGIGRFLTERLLNEGHQVWGLARSEQRELGQARPGFYSDVCDVSDWSQVIKSVGTVRRAWGKIDALIACAGIQGEIGPAMQADPEKWSATVRANLDGTYYFIRGFFPLLQSSNRSKIICFSGGGSTKPRINFSAYGAAKTAIVRLVETLSEEWKELPIDINSVAPGAIYTRLTKEVLELGPEIVGQAEYESASKQNPDSSASLEKVGKLVSFLLSSKSDGVTGRLLSAPWDPWEGLEKHQKALSRSDIYTLRRIVPEERNFVID